MSALAAFILRIAAEAAWFAHDGRPKLLLESARVTTLLVRAAEAYERVTP